MDVLQSIANLALPSLTGAELDRAIAALAHQIERSGLIFVNAWWHGDDVDSAVQSLREALTRHDLGELFPEDLIAARTRLLSTEVSDDEEQVRRHQIGLTATHVNEQLRKRGDSRRFRALGKCLEWESDEPVWLRVTPEEHAALLAIAGPPSALEAVYDAAESIADLPDTLPDDPAPPSKSEALSRARTAMAAQRYEEALAMAEIAAGGGSHGLLGDLIRIDALHHLGRRDDAHATWTRTADEWLSGIYRVWDTQWQTLVSLHGKLGMAECPQVAEARKRAGSGQ